MISVRFTFTIRQTWSATTHSTSLDTFVDRVGILVVRKEQALRSEISWKLAAAKASWVSATPAQNAVSKMQGN